MCFAHECTSANTSVCSGGCFPRITGEQCDRCADGYYNFPTCSSCSATCPTGTGTNAPGGSACNGSTNRVCAPCAPGTGNDGFSLLCETVTTTTTTLAPMCGDANGDGRVLSTDALLTLKAAVGSITCRLARCDADGNGRVASTDALIILQFAVGVPGAALHCPMGVTTTTIQ
jgi:hypothetical protein